jgi:hypothetical protein
MPDVTKTLTAAAAVLLAASIGGAATPQHTPTERHAPSVAAPPEDGRGPVRRMTGPSITATGPDTPGQ